MQFTFVTGNPHKAEQLAKWIGMTVPHHALDLDEIQSVNLQEIVDHKARQAYATLQKPVLVEDVELCCDALGGLPGPFIKWFVKQDVGLPCRILQGFDSRRAAVRLLYALYDGKVMCHFAGEITGVIAANPRGSGGFGFDAIFIPDGHTKTRAEMDDEEYEQTSHRAQALKKLKEFLANEKV